MGHSNPPAFMHKRLKRKSHSKCIPHTFIPYIYINKSIISFLNLMVAVQPETGELQQECVDAFYFFRAKRRSHAKSPEEGSLGVEMVALGMTSDRHHLINVRGRFPRKGS